MLFYEIKLHSLPRLLFACEVTAENYSNKFPWREDFLEIGLIRSGSMVFEPDNGEGKVECFKAGSLQTILPDFLGKTYSETGNCHLTAGISVQYSWQLHSTRDMNDKQLLDCMEKAGKDYVYLLPFRGSSVDHYPGAIRILEEIAHNNLRGEASDKNLCVSGFLQLLSYLTAGCLYHLKTRREVSGFTAKQNLCETIKGYITIHYREKITLEILSQETGFSPNYLCRVFKVLEGISIMEYLTGFRMNMARDMIAEGGMTAGQIATAVGISDEFYLSKLFRKQFGMGIQTYRSSLRSHGNVGPS